MREDVMGSFTMADHRDSHASWSASGTPNGSQWVDFVRVDRRTPGENRERKRSRITYLLRTVLAIATLAGALRTAAQDIELPDDTLPGFRPNQIYHSSGIDNVSLYSGDPGVVIPLGPEYQLSYGLKWSLKAYYSAKLWREESKNCLPYPNNPSMISWLNGQPDLGAGWTLSLGYVSQLDPLYSSEGETYHSPDGAEHSNFVSAVSSLCPSGVKCTNDGSQLRLRYAPGGGYIVDFPDGSHHYFESAGYHGVDASNAATPDFYREKLDRAPLTRYGLTRIVDKLDRDVLTVSYLTQGRINQITLRPNTAEAATITFNWRPGGLSIQSGALTVNWPVLNSITFPVTGGLTTDAVFTIEAGIFPRPGGTGGGGCTFPADVMTPLLKGIQFDTQTYQFAYQETTPGIDLGVLTDLTLPTGGVISYTYGSTAEFGVSSPSGCDTAPQRPPAPEFWPEDWEKWQTFQDASPGVVKREERLVAKGTPVKTVTYARHNIRVKSQDAGGSPFLYRRAVAKDADGYQVHYFTAVAGSGFRQGLELRRLVYDNAFTPPTACEAPYPDPAPLRTIVNCYTSLQANGNVAPPGCGVRSGNQNYIDMSAFMGDAIVQKGVTWYGASPQGQFGDQCLSATGVACWETSLGGGNYVTDFNVAAREYATETKRTNSGTLLYAMDSRTTTTTWSPSVSSDRWLLKLFTAKEVKDHYPDDTCPALYSPCRTYSTYTFNTSTGFLEQAVGSETVSGAGGSTLTRQIVRTGSDFRETVSGTGLIDTQKTYTTKRSYSPSGLLLTATKDPDVATWSAYRVDRDSSTGLIKSSYDPNLLRTDYGYDSLGRIKTIDPPGDDATATYCYDDVNRYVIAKKGIASPCSTSITDTQLSSGTFEAYQFDQLGRLRRQIKALPNLIAGVRRFGLQETRYDLLGHKVFESEWTSCGTSSSASTCFSASATAATTYSNFDFQGRPLTIQRADGSTITKEYRDPDPLLQSTDFTEQTLVSNVQVSGVVQTLRSAIRKDMLGRALLVTEPQVELAQRPTSILQYDYRTAYSYNVLDKLTDVAVGITEAGSQTRQFSYSSLGFLRSETHPEKGTTSYTLYDPLLNVRTRTEGSPTNYTYTSTYDSLGRLLTLSSVPTAGGATQTHLTNTYDTAGGLYPKGKLTKRVGTNPSTGEDVTEEFTFSEAAGRLSAKKTTIGASIFNEAWLYNGLGLVSRYDHPRATGTFSELTSYKAGAPVSSTLGGEAAVQSATYNPAGGLASYKTGNNVETKLDQDSTLLPRPVRIYTTLPGNSTPTFDTSTMSYDGAGNLASVGSDAFQYDDRGRLTRATYSNNAARDIFTYDKWGSIKSYAKEDPNNPSQDLQYTFSVDVATNRVSPGTTNYDSLGNLTSTPVASGNQIFTYDRLSRLIQTNSPSEQYLYDAAAERIAKTISVPNNQVCLPGFTVPSAQVGYSWEIPGGIQSTGGIGPFTWTTVGSLPPGITLIPDASDSSKARVAGTPTTVGNYSLQLRVADSTGLAATTPSFTINVAPAGGLKFYTVTPCRLLDTRGAFGQPYAGPRLDLSASTKTLYAWNNCGIPNTARTLAANITVTGSLIQNGPSNSLLYIRDYPVGAAPPQSWATAFRQTLTRATQTMITLDTNTGGFVVKFGAEGGVTQAYTDVILDISGYFGPAGFSTVAAACSATQQANVRTYTLRDSGSRVATEYVGGSPTRDNAYLGHLLIGSRFSTGWEFYGHDHLGTVRIVTNSAGQLVNQPKYRVFGVAMTAPSTTQRFSFAGMEREAPLSGDMASERYYDHARLISAYRGRFNSPDQLTGKIEDPQSWHRYAYARNNPLKYVDPDGRNPVAIAIGWSALRAAAVEAMPVIGATVAAVATHYLVKAALSDFNRYAFEYRAFGSQNSLLQSSSGDASSAGGEKKSPTVQDNKKQGDEFRDKVAEDLKAQGKDVQKEVRKDTPFGPRYIDIEIQENGEGVGGVETKTGNSRYTPSQRAKDEYLRRTEDYPVTVVRDH